MTNDEKPWHQKEEFWKDSPFNIDVIEKAPEEVDNLISLADLNPDMKVLDLCCGVGRHSIEFAKRGFDVSGVDITDHYLKKAKQRAKEEDLDIKFIKGDMREFRRKETFDLVLNLFTSFGFFEEHEENMKVLENVYESLKPKGKFIIDVMGKEIIARIFKERDWKEMEDGFWLFERSIEKNWSWMENRRIKITDEGRKEYNVDHWLYSAKELENMLKEVGFDPVKVYGSYDGAPYDENANRLVVVAEK